MTNGYTNIVKPSGYVFSNEGTTISFTKSLYDNESYSIEIKKTSEDGISLASQITNEFNLDVNELAIFKSFIDQVLFKEKISSREGL